MTKVEGCVGESLDESLAASTEVKREETCCEDIQSVAGRGGGEGERTDFVSRDLLTQLCPLRVQCPEPLQSICVPEK